MNSHTKQLVSKYIKPLLINLGFVVFVNHSAMAEDLASSLIPPTDPTQSITYWKKYTLDDSDPVVELSQQVFSVLLRAWDQSRIEPGLFVVDSAAGAWAASLADGNILLSKQAIETSFSFGQQRGEHLLAFILAHELAHQRADDLWHQRFFRMIGTHSTESQKKMLAGLDLDTEMLSQLEQKEAQADHDGLVLMSSVGYDPYQIVADKDFFTLWVENVWHGNCADTNQASSNIDACKQAQARALRTQAQLKTVATQSMLYELGVQHFVAGNYQQARNYFMIYGRDYPGRAIITAIGLTYFAQAQSIQQQLNELEYNSGTNQQASFYYPMLLDAHVSEVDETLSSQNKRTDIRSLIEKLTAQKEKFLNQSISQFEKAIRLAPEYQQTYLFLASAHILSNNSYRVRGVLQGQYLQKFKPANGYDSAVEMLLALTTAIEGNTEQAIKSLNSLIRKMQDKSIVSALPENVMRYSATYNLAELYNSINKKSEAKQAWLDLAQLSKKTGDTLLFRLALSHINPESNTVHSPQLKRAPTIMGKRLGDKVLSNSNPADLWIDGERFQLDINENTKFISNGDGTLIGAWQNSNTEPTSAHISHTLQIGDAADRPFKALGMPDRHLNMTSGEYLAYDDYGLAIRISNNRVKGWFLYDEQ